MEKTTTNPNTLASYYKAREFFYTWISLQKQDLKKSLCKVEKGEMLYHISNNGNIRRFFPKIPQQTKPGEDQTIARICTSNRILDAFVGMLDTSALDRLQVKSGLLTIYRFNPIISVRPSKKALPNNTNLNERWIVAYDPTYNDYDSEVSGKMLITEAKADGDVITVGGYLHSYYDAAIVDGRVMKGGTTKKFWLCVEITEGGVVTHKVDVEECDEAWSTIKATL